MEFLIFYNSAQNLVHYGMETKEPFGPIRTGFERM